MMHIQLYESISSIDETKIQIHVSKTYSHDHIMEYDVDENTFYEDIMETVRLLSFKRSKIVLFIELEDNLEFILYIRDLLLSLRNRIIVPYGIPSDIHRFKVHVSTFTDNPFCTQIEVLIMDIIRYERIKSFEDLIEKFRVNFNIHD